MKRQCAALCMKARLVRNGDKVVLLCPNGSICNATPALMTHFLLHFHDISKFKGEDGNWLANHLEMSAYPGETLAYVTDGGHLLTMDAWVNETVVSHAVVPPRELTLLEYAKKHNRSKEMIKVLLREGRIPGAIMRGRQWFIPENAPYPIEERSRRAGSGRVPYKNDN